MPHDDNLCFYPIVYCRTATLYDRLLPWSCHLSVCVSVCSSVCLSVTKCTVAKQHILQQKYLNKWTWNKWWWNAMPPTNTILYSTLTLFPQIFHPKFRNVTYLLDLTFLITWPFYFCCYRTNTGEYCYSGDASYAVRSTISATAALLVFFFSIQTLLLFTLLHITA